MLLCFCVSTTFRQLHSWALWSLQDLVAKTQEAKAKMVVATDLLACTMLTPPGEWGADIVIGSAQRFGVPMGYGGPHAAFLACANENKRLMPGRIIGWCFACYCASVLCHNAHSAACNSLNCKYLGSWAECETQCCLQSCSMVVYLCRC